MPKAKEPKKPEKAKKLPQKDYEKKVLELAKKNLTSEKIGEKLRKQGVVFDYISFFGKPIASLYIDDKGFRFNNNWAEVKEFIDKNENIPEIIEELNKKWKQ